MSRSAKKEKHRYALIGTGGRSRMFTQSILTTHKASSLLVALCDTNQTRMDYNNGLLQKRTGCKPIPTYLAADFDRMIREKKPHTIIVTTMDRTHHDYIIRAMELGCDVITEKPMTVDAQKCQAILDTVKRTGRKLRVTFNYRYAPVRTTVKDLLMKKVVGDVTSVHFEWLLDTTHGADYFRRWHRNKINSGGLMVHKSTHHFDLVNWWLDSTPETVFGFGALSFYGKVNAEKRGDYHPYVRATGNPAAKNDPFALNLKDGGDLEGLYYNAEKEDSYWRDQNVFGDGINIEDTMNVLVRYKNGAHLSYSLTAYAPWEGYRIAFNCTRGRIEVEHMEKSYINAGGGVGEAVSHSHRVTVLPQREKPYVVEPPPAVGGHGGGDEPLLEDIFGSGKKKDPYKRAAGHIDGAMSILTGIAANQSFATGLPVQVDSLVKFD